MPLWIDGISKQLDNLVEAEFFEPPTELKQGDQVVGIAGEQLRRIYTLMLLLQRRALEADIEAKFSNDKIREESELKAMRFAENAEVLTRIMWISVKEEFNLWNKPRVGLRTGWKVVWGEEDTPSISDVLGGLFGGRG